MSQTPPRFDGVQAFQIVQEFVTRNPMRVMGSIEARQATGYIRDFLIRQGYQVDSPSYFNAIIAGKRQAGSNIVAFRAGVLPEILAVAAHYDTARTARQGAMDDGSGVGAALELARIFAAEPLRHSLLVIATDGEEWGMLGAADFAANYPGRSQIAAVLSLDYVSIGDLAELQLDTDGQKNGFTPGWLRRIALHAAGMQGLPVVSPAGISEYFQRAVALSLTDQGPFLRAGIPAINLGSSSVDRLRERDIYHSQNDTVENLKSASIGNYGQAAERILRSLDELSVPPSAMDNAFRWRDDKFVAGWAVALLQYLTFLPFVAMLGFAWAQQRKYWNSSIILRETVFTIAWFVPFGLAYSLILFCRLMRFLPHNSLYPGPLKDSMLEPSWGVFAGIFLTALAVGVGLHFLARFLTRGLPRSFGASKTLLMTLLLVVIFFSFMHGPYWTSTFLTLPALVWGWIGQAKGAASRAVAVLALPAAGLAAFTATSFAGRDLGIGADVIWCAVLGLSNGMLSWQGYLLAAAVSVIGLRMLSLHLTRLPS